MRGKKSEGNLEEDWDDDWEEAWDDEQRLKSPIQRFVDWMGLNKLRANREDADDEWDDESDSLTQRFADWSSIYWQRMLAVVFFLIGLVLILRLAVLA